MLQEAEGTPSAARTLKRGKEKASESAQHPWQEQPRCIGGRWHMGQYPGGRVQVFHSAQLSFLGKRIKVLRRRRGDNISAVGREKRR